MGPNIRNNGYHNMFHSTKPRVLSREVTVEFRTDARVKVQVSELLHHPCRSEEVAVTTVRLGRLTGSLAHDAEEGTELCTRSEYV
jgi:hypothetical protein